MMGGTKTEYLSELGPVPLKVRLSHVLSRRSAARGPGLLPLNLTVDPAKFKVFNEQCEAVEVLIALSRSKC